MENQTFGESLSLGTPWITTTTSGTVIHKMEDSLTKAIEGMTENEVSISSTFLKRVAVHVQSNRYNSSHFSATTHVQV